MTVEQALIGAYFLTMICLMLVVYRLYGVTRRVQILETVLGQLGPEVASRIQESSTKVSVGDRWEEDMEAEVR